MMTRRRRLVTRGPAPRNTALLVEALVRFWAGFRDTPPPAVSAARKPSRHFRRPRRGKGRK